jgi:hypothetical protein
MTGNRWLGRALIEAARAAARTKSTSVRWNMLTTGDAYRELGEDHYYSQRHRRQTIGVRSVP